MQEYVDAAEFAKELEMPECFDEMMEMSRVEGEHEEFFRAVVAKHRLLADYETVFSLELGNAVILTADIA